MRFGVRSLSLLASKVPTSGSNDFISRTMFQNYLQKFVLFETIGFDYIYSKSKYKQMNLGRIKKYLQATCEKVNLLLLVDLF